MRYSVLHLRTCTAELGGSKDPFPLPPSHCHPEYLRGPFYHLAKFSQFCHNRQESVPSFCCHLTWKHCAVWLCFYLLCIFQVSGPACSHHFITFQISQVLSCDTIPPPTPSRLSLERSGSIFLPNMDSPPRNALC